MQRFCWSCSVAWISGMESPWRTSCLYIYPRRDNPGQLQRAGRDLLLIVIMTWSWLHQSDGDQGPLPSARCIPRGRFCVAFGCCIRSLRCSLI